MFRKIGCLWTWTKASGKSMNMEKHHTGPGQPHGAKKASVLSSSVSGKRSRFSCYCGQQWDSQHNLWFTFKVKSLYALKLSSMFMKRTRSYIWSWVWPLLVLDDRPTPVVLWSVTCHSDAPHPWKRHIIHPRWVLLSLWEVFWENHLSDVMSPELSQIAPGE